MSKKYHYVYYSYEEYGRGYIGSRSCSCLPQEDRNYFGSFTDKTFKPTEKIILMEFTLHGEALLAEKILHDFYNVVKNPHFANRAKITSTGFTTSGLIYSEESRQKMRNVALGRKQSRKSLQKKSESLKEFYSSNPDIRTGKNNHATGKRWFTNGKESILAFSCPDGFRLGRQSPSLETRIKQSNSHKGKKRSNAQREKMRGKNNPMYGKNGNQAPSYGKGWFTNGTENVLALECPKGYYKGRTMSPRKSKV